MRRLVVPLAALLVACSAVLGFEDLESLPADGGLEGASQSSDAAGSVDTGGGDGQSTADASREAAASDGGGDASCTANFTNDERHCGRCNHDCLGATCSGGKCQPLKLADGLAIPEGLVVDDANVYVTEWDLHRIVRFGKSALGPCTAAPLPAACVFESKQSNVFLPTAMGIDEGSIYWTNTGPFTNEVRSCPRSGCGAQAAKVIASLGDEAFGHLFGNEVLPLELVIRQGQVFWPESLGGAIRSAPVDGGAVTTYLENGDFMPLAIAVDDGNVYFTDDTNQHQTQIAAAPRSGSARDGGVRVVAETPARPFGISLAANGNLYWTVPSVSSDGLVQAAPKTSDGGAPIGAFAASQSEPHMIMTDAHNAYWVLSGDFDSATGMVVYCPLSGCPSSGPIVLARDQRFPAHLTQDEGAIYWSNEGLATSQIYDGQVWKIAKP